MSEIDPEKYVRLPVGYACLYYGAMILLAPIWVPLMIVGTLAFRIRLRGVLSGSIDDAWSRCAEVWSGVDTVYGAEVGPNFETPFAHSLAEHFASYQPKSREFLLRQLHHDDPHLAAYAFKALIRCKPTVHPADIPRFVLERPDELNVLRFGCCGETLPLSEYISEYFNTHQYAKMAS